jgi:4-amino-4-deoxy-L-arabinose transferase-like glycosyltransferase
MMSARFRITSVWRAMAVTLILSVAAFLPRLVNLGEFITSDEANFWLRRSVVFLQALRSGDYGATAISTHPGVTTMWLGATGILLRQELLAWGIETPTFAMRLALMRLPVALVHGAAVLAGYVLLRRLFRPIPAVLAAMLWALDPFVVGFSRLLHVDMLAGSFLTLSLLAMLVAVRGERRMWRYAIASGIAGGLAILSKSPALALLPGVALLLALDTRRRGGFGWRSRAALGGVWLLACTITIVAAYPALWVDPLRVVHLVQLGVEAEGAQPHMLGNYFLGRQDDAPGPLFYPVAVALRLTPWALLGLLALPVALRPLPIPSDDVEPSLLAGERLALATLAGFALIFILALTPFPKKFNRYLLPVFPALDILAAWGLYWLATRLRGLGRSPARGRRRMRVVLRLIAALAVVNAICWRGIEIDYYNQALGGSRAGSWAFSTGWGEGLAEAAAWLNQQPDITGVLVASTQVPTLQPYLRPGAQAITPDGALPPETGYVVVYVRDVQGGPLRPPFDEFYGRQQPVRVIRHRGVTYAWIYQVAPPAACPAAAAFGAMLRLRGYSQTAPLLAGQAARFTLSWERTGTVPAETMLFAHLIAATGTRIAQADLPFDTRGWGAGPYARTELALPLPARLSPGEYWLTIGLYDAASGRRVPLAGGDDETTFDGDNALVLGAARLSTDTAAWLVCPANEGQGPAGAGGVEATP